MIGKLNYDVWKEVVGYLVDDLRVKRDFPTNPEVKQLKDEMSKTLWCLSMVIRDVWWPRRTFHLCNHDRQIGTAHDENNTADSD